ncbi:hypothetical protein SLE2022_038400 [Rubroshorea leprosula]
MGLLISPKDEPQQQNRAEKKPKIERQGMAQIEIVDLEGDPFCFLPISGKGTTMNDAISVEQYSQDRDLQSAIGSSQKNFIDLDSYDEDLIVLNCKPGITPRKRRKAFTNFSVTEPGESSNSKIAGPAPDPAPAPAPPFVCEICVEHKSQTESFRIKGCSHSYCTDCVAKFVAAKLQENITAIRCPVPNCSGLLEPEYCRRILPPEVFNRWGDALCEAVILGSQSFYCPYKDCSALLIDDGCQEVMQSSCPNCWRMFCAQCKVPWHTGIECAEFQKLHDDEREQEDIMLLKLAQNQKWARCPKCRFVVERTEGCRYMKCRCGTAFCYSCGGTTIDNYHYCHSCKC